MEHKECFMKNLMKVLGIITLAMAIVFSFVACGENGDPTIPPAGGEIENPSPPLGPDTENPSPPSNPDTDENGSEISSGDGGDGDPTIPSGSGGEDEPKIPTGTGEGGDIDEPIANPVSVQEMLDKAETHQESDSSAEFISAAFDPDLKYVILTYKVGTIKNMFLQYLSTVVVAGPGRELTYSEIVGNSLTEQVENIHTTAMNFNGTVWSAGAGAIAGAFAGANASAALGSLTNIEPEAKANAYAFATAAAGTAAGKVSIDLASVRTTRYTQTYHQFLVVQNTIKQDMSIYPAGKKYAVAAFADVGIYQILRYDPQTKTATAIPGKSLWFNVESRPYWDMYEYSREEELSIPQQLTPFERVNVEVKDELYVSMDKITFDVGNPRVSSWYRTDWKPITLPLSLLREFGYKTVSFEWKTYWAENEGNLDCTAHVVLDCADRNLSRGNDWSYYDQIVNPGAVWKWATWNFSSPIGTVADRPYIRCAYGYGSQEKSYFLGIETGTSYYDLSETVSVTVTAQK